MIINNLNSAVQEIQAKANLNEHYLTNNSPIRNGNFRLRRYINNAAPHPKRKHIFLLAPNLSDLLYGSLLTISHVGF